MAGPDILRRVAGVLAAMLILFCSCFQNEPIVRVAQNGDEKKVPSVPSITTKDPADVFPTLPTISSAMQARTVVEIKSSKRIESAYRLLDARQSRQEGWSAAIDRLTAENAVWCLQTCLCHPEQEVRIKALHSVEQLGNESAIPFLLLYAEYINVPGLQEQQSESVNATCKAVASALSALTRVEAQLGDVDSGVLGEAIRTWRAAVPARSDADEAAGLAEWTDSESRDLIHAVTATAARPRHEFPTLPSISSTMQQRVDAEVDSSDTIGQALGLLDRETRDNVDWLEGIARLEREQAVWCLQSCLTHPHDDVQAQALRSLERLRDKRAVPFLLVYADYMAVSESGSENATLHGILHQTIAGTLSKLTGIEVRLDGQDPEGLRTGIVAWSKWVVENDESP